MKRDDDDDDDDDDDNNDNNNNNNNNSSMHFRNLYFQRVITNIIPMPPKIKTVQKTRSLQ